MVETNSNYFDSILNKIASKICYQLKSKSKEITFNDLTLEEQNWIQFAKFELWEENII